MSSLLRSLRLAARSLRRSRSFSLVAIITFALGIGATTAIFGVVDAVLLDPLPYPESERLAAISSRWQDEAQGQISPAEYFDYAAELESATAFGVWGIGSLTLTGSGEAEQIPAGYLSHGALPAFGVRPLHGRSFTEAEDAPGAAPVALLSYGLWQRRFGGRADAVGSSIVADGTAVTIIGVMPRSFRLPEDFEAGESAGLYLPLQLERPAPDDRGSHFLEGIARLAPGATIHTLSADAARIAAEFQRAFPDEYPREMGFTAFAMPLRESILGPVRPLVLLVFGAAALVLLIACVNVANLVVVRSDRRERELAVRAAMGAERRHLLHQFLAETLLLALAGGALGLAIAAAATRLLPRILPPEVPIPGELAIDWRVTAFAFTVVIATAIVTAIAPLFRRRGDLPGALREE
ncbi:MAG: ABC transporter permease, partial [Thermoanaerobaculia bacterium]